jgi:ABC-type sugar transport system ATPase subunit
VSGLSLRAVSKIYGDSVVALDAIDLDTGPSEILGVVGPSGSGKSTLLRIIAGLEPASSGHIALDGTTLDGLPPRDRDVALMFQEHTLLPHLRVADNLGFGLRLRGATREVTRARIAEAADRLGLGVLLDRYPDQLSGGERQRVALGRALVRRPRLLLLDEPLSSVDTPLRAQLRVEIARTSRTLGAILILVTHDQMDAMSIADRIAVMQRGRIEQIGDPASVYASPSSRFVAEFIGPHGMNFFEGRLQRNGRDLRFVHSEFSIGVPVEWHARLGALEASDVTLGVRPEGLCRTASGDSPILPSSPGRELPSSRAPEPPAVLRSTVELIERTGPQAFLLCSLGGHRYWALDTGPRPPAPGESVAFRVDLQAARFFTLDGRAC